VENPTRNDKTKENKKCACVNPFIQMPELLDPSQTGPEQASNLCRNSILDLAVDSTHLPVDGLLSLLNDVVDAVLNIVDAVLDIDAGLVTTIGKDLGVVGRTTTVPGQKLNKVRIE
jgi:hypothetical protein